MVDGNNEDFKMKVSEWRGYVAGKLEEFSNNQVRMVKRLDEFALRESITRQDVDRAIEQHSRSCLMIKAGPTKNNTLDVVKGNSKLLGVIAGLVGIISLLVQGLFTLLNN